MNKIAKKIRMDFREERSGIWKILTERFEIEVVKDRLLVGDYLIKDIVVERKTASDFVQSIIDGRLFIQAKRMKGYNDLIAIFIVEGDIFIRPPLISTPMP
ncbi:MAG: ERCC4 domain-containing protein [bacterium]|nr:ERCC4 domain-containing protein [bacterium]